MLPVPERGRGACAHDSRNALLFRHELKCRVYDGRHACDRSEKKWAGARAVCGPARPRRPAVLALLRPGLDAWLARRRELGATRNKDMTDQSRSQERRRRHGHGHHDQDRPPSPRAPCLRRSGAGVRREERHVKKQRASHGDGGALLYILRSLTACTFSGR